MMVSSLTFRRRGQRARQPLRQLRTESCQDAAVGGDRDTFTNNTESKMRFWLRGCPKPEVGAHPRFAAACHRTGRRVVVSAALSGDVQHSWATSTSACSVTGMRQTKEGTWLELSPVLTSFTLTCSQIFRPSGSPPSVFQIFSCNSNCSLSIASFLIKDTFLWALFCFVFFKFSSRVSFFISHVSSVRLILRIKVGPADLRCSG